MPDQPSKSTLATRHVLAELARRDVITTREALADASDLLGLGHRPATRRGIGKRVWTGQEVDALEIALGLRARYQLGLDDLRLVLDGTVAPERVIRDLVEPLDALRAVGRHVRNEGRDRGAIPAKP